MPTLQWGMWRTDWLLFAPSPLPAEFPEVAEGLSEPLGCSSWGNPLAATYPALEPTLHRQPSLETILERGAQGPSLSVSHCCSPAAMPHRALQLGRDTPLHPCSPSPLGEGRPPFTPSCEDHTMSFLERFQAKSRQPCLMTLGVGEELVFFKAKAV